MKMPVMPSRLICYTGIRLPTKSNTPAQEHGLSRKIHHIFPAVGFAWSNCSTFNRKITQVDIRVHAYAVPSYTARRYNSNSRFAHSKLSRFIPMHADIRLLFPLSRSVEHRFQDGGPGWGHVMFSTVREAETYSCNSSIVCSIWARPSNAWRMYIALLTSAC